MAVNTETVDSAAEEQIVEEQDVQTEERADDKADAISKDELTRLLEDRDKRWQSRFDKVLAEKKAEENKALTVEQRIQQLEEERRRERTDWSRKEARARAEIDDVMDEAIRLYASDDPEQISEGASHIKQWLDAKVSEYTKQIEELEKKLRFGGKLPTGGGKGDSAAMPMAEFEKLTPKDKAAYMSKGGKLE